MCKISSICISGDIQIQWIFQVRSISLFAGTLGHTLSLGTHPPCLDKPKCHSNDYLLYIYNICVYIYTRVYIYIHNRQMQVIIIYSVCNCCYHHVPHNISRLCPVNFALHFAPGPSTAGEPPTALSEPAVCHLCHAHNMMENTIAYMIGF